MRIQHNIMSMNAYRNYNNNASALGKNLEKLSSGYKINRAGDDAAGLAISEKMRAQIKGLDAATKNVKDGISLVKTAEGAMQEIQDMLSRMKYLATQSANGTYDDDVDRKALQNEVDQLNSEINRIADSANFNGTKLLDGSLAGGGSTSSGPATVAAPTVDGFTIQSVAGAKASMTLTFTAVSSIGGNVTLSAEVNGKTITVELTAKENTAGTKLELYNGDKKVGTDGNIKTGHNIGVIATGAKLAAATIASIMKDKIASELGGDYDVTNNAGVITIKSKVSAAGTLSIGGGAVTVKSTDGLTSTVTVATAATGTEGKDKSWTFSATGFALSSKASTAKVYTINGQKFAFAKMASAAVAKEMAKLDPSIKVINMAAAPAATNADEIVVELTKLTGLNLAASSAGTITVMPSTGGTKSAGGGLQLQIGDTGDSYNQLDVVVKDLHAAAVGCAGVDISTIGGAQAAIDTVKDCINYVSEIRGKLGATQNRLEHTQNNLSVMKENIQDAESTIRDTDVADEMMAYTKNNILIQSAQAMLAQANAVPQGVLQLLQ